MKLKFIKWCKANFIRFHLHNIFLPISTLMIYLGEMSKLSAWVAKHREELEINDHYNPSIKHKDRFKLYQFVLDKYQLAQQAITYIEFGVASGNSMRWWSEHNTSKQSQLHGFDTFTGLPEDYGHYEAGLFDQGGQYPDIKDDRIQFVPGYFQASLLPHLKHIDFTNKSIIHVDGDLYNSGIYPLYVLLPYIKTGDIIIFDEWVVPLHEWRVFRDFTESAYIELKPIGAVNNYLQFAFEVGKLRTFE